MGVSETVIELFLSSVYFAIYFVVKHELFSVFSLLFMTFLPAVLRPPTTTCIFIIIFAEASIATRLFQLSTHSKREREKIVLYRVEFYC